ncbi:MAG TPA: ribosome-binding factor A, partial [Polyangiaceae bacterium]
MPEDSRRVDRVAGLVRAHLTELMRRELGDSELAEVVVTEVALTKDLSIARILVRSLAATDDLNARAKLLS